MLTQQPSCFLTVLSIFCDGLCPMQRQKAIK
nr:MAG TPA: protein of unknown function (DUF1893) [Bacteriophage sp.]